MTTFQEIAWLIQVGFKFCLKERHFRSKLLELKLRQVDNQIG